MLRAYEGLPTELPRDAQAEEASRVRVLVARPSWERRRMPSLIKELDPVEAVFSRTDSLAEVVENLIRSATFSVHAAVYRFNSQRIARALGGAHRKGTKVRLVIDKSRYGGSQAAQKLLAKAAYPFRLALGRGGKTSKMHHKFVVVDECVVLTGSYNWTYASEEKNYESLLILTEPVLIEAHLREFHELWADGAEPPLPANAR